MQLRAHMMGCQQSTSENVLEHGQAVASAYKALLERPPECLIPQWDLLMADLSTWNPQDIETYQVYHDCGKPFCLETDQEGRRHFPEHAQTSYQAFLEAGGCPLIANWILRDMDIHVIAASGIEAFANLVGSEVLLLTGFAELEANAAAFGGHDSLSYKIKHKHLVRRAKAYLRWRYCV